MYVIIKTRKNTLNIESTFQTKLHNLKNPEIMKNFFTVLVMIFGFMMIPNITSAQTAGIEVASVDLTDANEYNKNTYLDARASTTANPDDGFPNVIATTDGARVPTIGELKDKVVKYNNRDGLTSYRHKVTIVGNYRNLPRFGSESWDYTYWVTPNDNPEYRLYSTISITIWTQKDGSQNVERRVHDRAKVVHKKTGEAYFIKSEFQF